MPTIPKEYKLNTGASIPTVGLGTWQARAENAVYEAVKTALKAGYRHIDTAFLYGNEAEVGRGIRDGLKETGLTRQDIFVTTKLAPIHARPSHVGKAFAQSLASLDIGYVDLYLLHWPVALNPATGQMFPLRPDGTRDLDTELDGQFELTWQAMEQLVGDSLKAIGVCNFSIPNLDRLLKVAKIIPAVNQIELHPYLPQFKLLDYCARHAIHVTAYSPLGSSNSPLLTDSTLQRIADHHHVSVPQVMISWGALRGSVIPKSVTPSRIESNFVLVDLTDDDVKAINEISNKHTQRIIRPPWGVPVFDEDF
ncbi:NADP-dependent oxidoreductase domain-containing protein [Halteromyces radiatus]|uniref:NADP-dependent oxidoreductase domain-containing protein n=1 Tax=Halteromyces radiatus TaxID=101107 RepID=UPI00221E7C53|nr:NADP-dependent oxidoreductase domain-containing protein [Halteromyces radiatus]KAI8099142.1 NADP-dependent oxidoreductase domain-containing protein [Halteromyces radiatus]